MDQSNGLEAKISIGKIRITIMTDLQKVFLYLIEVFLQGLTSHMRTIARTTEEHTINAQNSHSIEKMEIDLEMDLSIFRMATGATVENFLVLRRLKEETSHKITPIASQEVINITTQLSVDPTTDLQLVFQLTNTSSYKAIIRHHLMSFASPPLTIPLRIYQIFAP